MAFKRDRLAQRRRAVGYSQERLAEMLDIERSTLGRWERAETNPLPWHRPKLARALKVSLDELDELLGDVHTVGDKRDERLDEVLNDPHQRRLGSYGLPLPASTNPE